MQFPTFEGEVLPQWIDANGQNVYFDDLTYTAASAGKAAN